MYLSCKLGDTFSTSDSTTYYEDDFSCSDESSADDDDSEPIFWLWFEERTPGTESSQAANENSEATTAEAKPANNNRAGSIVPDKAEPHGYLALATLIFKVIFYLMCKRERIRIFQFCWFI